MKYEKELIGKIIKKEREKRNLTQEKLGNSIGISGKQISKYEKGELFPPLDALCSLCEKFDCELGYLLGEPSYAEGTSLDSQIYNYLGLNKNSINILYTITGSSKQCLSFGYESDQYRLILNTLFQSPAFINLLEDIKHYHDYYNSDKRNNPYEKQLYSQFSKEIIAEAFELFDDAPCLLEQMDISPELHSAIILAQKAQDFNYDLDTDDLYEDKVFRYDVQCSFQEIINFIFNELKNE